MRYNKWKEANNYWRMVINKPFKVKGRNIMLLNYRATYSSRPNKSSYVTKTMHRFINYLNTIGEEIYSYTTEFNRDTYGLLYTNSYRKELIGINPYISITYEQITIISNFVNAYRHYYSAYYNRSKLRKPIINSLLDAIDEISSIQDILRQYRYNKTHKRKHPYPLINNNYFEHDEYPHTPYYDSYKQFYLNCLKHNIDITKTFYNKKIYKEKLNEREQSYNVF